MGIGVFNVNMRHDNRMGNAITRDNMNNIANGTNAYNALTSSLFSRNIFEIVRNGVDMLVRARANNANSCIPTW